MPGIGIGLGLAAGGRPRPRPPLVMTWGVMTWGDSVFAWDMDLLAWRVAPTE